MPKRFQAVSLIQIGNTYMSRGPGKIERAIEALFQEHPDDAFSVEDIADHIYVSVNVPRSVTAYRCCAPPRRSAGG
jgi:hypothetical protein